MFTSPPLQSYDCFIEFRNVVRGDPNQAAVVLVELQDGSGPTPVRGRRGGGGGKEEVQCVDGLPPHH